MKAKGYSTIAGLEKLTPEEIKARNLETYGNQIRKYRKKAGLAVEELADILQISKISVRNWECGLTRPDPEFLYRMFSILDVEPFEFIAGSTDINTAVCQGAVNIHSEQTIHYSPLSDEDLTVGQGQKPRFLSPCRKKAIISSTSDELVSPASASRASRIGSPE